MSKAGETIRRAVEGVTALYENGDPGPILNHVRDAEDEVMSLGVVSGVALLAASAMKELNRVTGDPNAGIEWLRREALKLQE